MDELTNDAARELVPSVETQGASGGAIEATPTMPEQSLGDTSRERGEAKSEQFYQKILSQVKSDVKAAKSDDDAKADAQSIAALADTESQVARLVSLASTQGVMHAVKVARMLDFYILDQVHDQLANKFYDTLVEQGLIERN